MIIKNTKQEQFDIVQFMQKSQNQAIYLNFIIWFYEKII